MQDQFIHFRVSNEVKEKLVEMAKEAGFTSVSEYLRVLLHKLVTGDESVELDKIARMWRKRALDLGYKQEEE